MVAVKLSVGGHPLSGDVAIAQNATLNTPSTAVSSREAEVEHGGNEMPPENEHGANRADAFARLDPGRAYIDPTMLASFLSLSQCRIASMLIRNPSPSEISRFKLVGPALRLVP